MDPILEKYQALEERVREYTPNLDAQKPQLKDSTEQESLMKPFYLTF